MNSVGEIHAAVERRIQEQHGKIIGGVFSLLIKRHNSFCGCGYCVILKDYAESKKAEHRYFRRYMNDTVAPMHEEAHIYGGLLRLRNEADSLKNQKDALKREAIKYIA